MPVVDLDRISKSYSSKAAVRDLSLRIEPGTMFGLLGPNGAGKTSSIRMMVGITLPDSGSSEPLRRPFRREQLRRVGYLPEERGLYKQDEGNGSAHLYGPTPWAGARSSPNARARMVRTAEDCRRGREEDGGAFQGNAAEDPVHCDPAARARTDHHG